MSDYTCDTVIDHILMILVAVRYLAIVAVVLGAAGCPPAKRTTVRLINGRPQPGRYVSPGAYTHYLQAQIALHRGELKRAHKEIRSALTLDPSSPYLHHHLAMVLVRQGKLEQAQGALKRTLELEPAFPDALVLLGKLHWQKRQTAQAEAHFRLCIRTNPSLPDAYLLLADLLQQKNRPEEASKVLKQMIAKARNTAEGHHRLAVLCLRKVSYQCAARHFELALQARTDLSTLIQLAHVYRSLGRMRLTIRLLREAFDRSDGDHRVAAGLMEVLQQVGDKRGLDDLVGVLERAARDNPRKVKPVAGLCLAFDRPRRALSLLDTQLSRKASIELQLMRAEVLFKLGQTKEADKLLRNHLSGSYGVQATLRLARQLARQRSFHEASDLLRQSLRQHGFQAETTLALSQSLYQEGKMDASIQVMRNALLGRPDNRQLRFGLAAALERAGRWRKAITEMRAILAKSPKDASAHNFIGYTQVERGGDLDAAERSIRKALFLQPGEGYIIDSLGWLHFRRGNLARAQRLLKMAARLAPREAEILAHVAEVNVALKQLSKAIQLLNKAISLCEDQRLTRRLRKRLAELEASRVGTRSP